jgi:hypothetical protein
MIGEAGSAEARGRLASLDWKRICGMRDVMIHDYIGVDLDEVWNVAAARIPELQAVLEHSWRLEVPVPRRSDDVWPPPVGNTAHHDSSRLACTERSDGLW